MDLAFWLTIAAAILCVAVAIYGESKKEPTGCMFHSPV